MNVFFVYRSFDGFLYNRAFLVRAKDEESAKEKVCEMLNNKYAVYDDFNGPPVDVNGGDLYKPNEFFVEAADFTDGDVLQIS